MNELDVFFLDLCFIRSLVNISAACINIRLFGKHILKDVPAGKFKIIGMRSIIGLFGFISIIYSLSVLPLTIVTIVFNTTTFWTGILAYYFLGDKVTKIEIFFMLAVFVGVILISITKHVDDEKPEKDGAKNVVSSASFTFCVLAVFYTSWSYSAISILTRKLKEVHFSLIMFHYGWFASTSIFTFLTIQYFVSNPKNYL